MFRNGDIIKCVDTSSYSNLTLNKSYEVLSCWNNFTNTYQSIKIYPDTQNNNIPIAMVFSSKLFISLSEQRKQKISTILGCLKMTE